ncbi:tellurite resistance TerB family protein [Kiloniella majae]|uniref:tellurite resistance TerB family protein n=1 Tax=Kiloniella majae TaxID=1938558 RepID=UPI000A277983|nr:TerB family tellurite resistance protein [Kiloniella majae]
MSSFLLEKLVTEVRRYQNKDFLHAAMAVCAITAYSDGEVSIEERYSIDYAIDNIEALQTFDPARAIEILDDYIYLLKTGAEGAKAELYKKIKVFEGNYKRSRTLLRVAHLIICADRDVDPREQKEFTMLCNLLGLEANKLWRQIENQKAL